MGGVALGRLWDTHPKVAFVLHLLLALYLGVLAVGLFISGNTGGGLVFTIGFVVMAGSLAMFTWFAAENDWQSDDTSDTSHDGRGRVVSPPAAWANTRAWGRILWALFGVAFLSSCALLIARSVAGVALIVVALALAIVAMRMD